jgi:hypothetical protein
LFCIAKSHDHPVNEDPLKMAQNERSGENLGLPERHVGASVPTPLIERSSIRGSRDHRVNVYNRPGSWSWMARGLQLQKLKQPGLRSLLKTAASGGASSGPEIHGRFS